jgi:hypothetical protein
MVSFMPQPPSSLWKTNLGTMWIGDWLGLRAGLVAVSRNYAYFCQELNPGYPTRRLSLYRVSNLVFLLRFLWRCIIHNSKKSNLMSRLSVLQLSTHGVPLSDLCWRPSALQVCLGPSAAAVGSPRCVLQCLELRVVASKPSDRGC